jgi:hypothetical protein
MFKVGDRVKVIKNGIEGVIKEIENELNYPEIEVGFIYDSEAYFSRYRENELELCEKDIQKTNRISRMSRSGLESIIEWNIEDKEIEITVSNHPINIVPLLKLILRETELYNYEYHRVSPYRLTRVYDTERCSHIFTFSFVDIRDEEFKITSQELMVTDKAMCIEGKIKIFIPDFLEICVERHMLARNGDRYELLKRLDNVFNNCRYIKSKPSISYLESKGFIIPEGYKKKLNS